jgi:hypothetical protein
VPELPGRVSERSHHREVETQAIERKLLEISVDLQEFSVIPGTHAAGFSRS